MDGEHHPLAELVLHAAVFPLYGKAGTDKVLELVAGSKRTVKQGSAAGWSPAQAEAFHSGIFQSPAAEVRLTERASLLGGELPAVEFLGVLHHEKQALVVLAFGNLLSRLLLLYDLDIVFLGQIAQSLGVGAVLLLHHETYGRAGFPAAEAFVYAFGRGDVERRRLLVMERTAGYEVGTPPLQGDEVTDYFNNLSRIQNLIYGILWNHPILLFVHLMIFSILYIFQSCRNL